MAENKKKTSLNKFLITINDIIGIILLIILHSLLFAYGFSIATMRKIIITCGLVGLFQVLILIIVSLMAKSGLIEDDVLKPSNGDNEHDSQQ